MTTLADLMPMGLLGEMLAHGYVRRQEHPRRLLSILNYTEKAAYEGVWNEATRQCRGLIATNEGVVVARPFPKFFNHGQEGAPELDLRASVVVTDKMDGSLGIVYRDGDEWSVATRGSFLSEQAIHATEILRSRYRDWEPPEGCTTLVEIVYPENRIVVDYAGLDDLVYLASLRIDDGTVEPWFWPGPLAEEFGYDTLAHALAAEPRPNREGLVVYLPDLNDRVKIKQDDYVALHRILTGTNARHVWEVAAVRACAGIVREPKHWGSFLGIDPERAQEVLALGDDWLAGVPDEFHGWVREVTSSAEWGAESEFAACRALAEEAAQILDRRARYEHVAGSVFAKEVMRLASAETSEQKKAALDSLFLRAWRESCPEPTAPFARPESIA